MIDGKTWEYFDFSSDIYQISTENEVPTFTFDTVPGLVTESFLISGTIYDDYLNFELTVYLIGWDWSYGPGYNAQADYNHLTGEWYFMFIHNKWDMPTGEHEIIVTFDPKYDDPIVLNQTTTFDDIEDPIILGVVDLGTKYPYGVTNNSEFVTVTVGVDDHYDITDDLTVHLYYYKDQGVALLIPMTQFASGGHSFLCDIPISYEPGYGNNYTYFIQVWDTSLNKATSEQYHFFVVPDSSIPPSLTGPTATISVGFHLIEIIIIGLVSLSLMLYSIIRKVKR
jgi:hypothetical protein